MLCAALAALLCGMRAPVSRVVEQDDKGESPLLALPAM